MKRRATGAATALTFLATSLGLVGIAAAAPLPGQAYQANASGSYANLGSTITSGASSPVGLSCAPQPPPGYHASNTVAGVIAAHLLTTGAIDTTVSTGPASGPALSTSTSQITGASALSGLVSATSVKAVSATSVGTSGYDSSGTGSSLGGLSVAGRTVRGTPAPNTTLPLPGVGKVVLNEQVKRAGSASATMTTNMIHVYVTTASPGVPAGTQIVIGHATSGLTQTIHNAPSLRGTAFSALAHVGTTITAGQEFPASMCGSTNGETDTNSAASTEIPGVLSSGAAANTVNGAIGATTSTAVSTATIKGLDLLSGLVTADAVKADAHASVTAGKVGLSEPGSTFTNLVVSGQAMPANTAPNTRITIGGITVWLNRVIQTGTGITVRMIEITVSGSNPERLPIGSDIQLAGASASAYPNPTG